MHGDERNGIKRRKTGKSVARVKPPSRGTLWDPKSGSGYSSFSELNTWATSNAGRPDFSKVGEWKHELADPTRLKGIDRFSENRFL